mmetsp:Transcript_28880/g.85929  ORF Transcript_28880/g.85929 Transcript_28880/m.85929 type:complete len:411 (+) Transcript_28880:1749-2981(+)
MWCPLRGGPSAGRQPLSWGRLAPMRCSTSGGRSRRWTSRLQALLHGSSRLRAATRPSPSALGAPTHRTPSSPFRCAGRWGALPLSSWASTIRGPSSPSIGSSVRQPSRRQTRRRGSHRPLAAPRASCWVAARPRPRPARASAARPAAPRPSSWAATTQTTCSRRGARPTLSPGDATRTAATSSPRGPPRSSTRRRAATPPSAWGATILARPPRGSRRTGLPGGRARTPGMSSRTGPPRGSTTRPAVPRPSASAGTTRRRRPPGHAPRRPPGPRRRRAARPPATRTWTCPTWQLCSRTRASRSRPGAGPARPETETSLCSADARTSWAVAREFPGWELCHRPPADGSSTKACHTEATERARFRARHPAGDGRFTVCAQIRQREQPASLRAALVFCALLRSFQLDVNASHLP